MQIIRNELSECELVIMKIIWDSESERTCGEVVSELKEKYGLNYADTTVYTFLKNLIEKGFVKKYKRGVTFFEAARSMEEYKEAQLRKMVDFWFDGSVEEMKKELDKIMD